MFGGFPHFSMVKPPFFAWQNPPLISPQTPPAPAVRLAAWPPWAARAKQWALVGFHGGVSPNKWGFHGDFMEISSTSDGDFNVIWGCPKIGIELFFFNFHRCTKIVGHPTFLLYPTKTLRLRLCLAEFRQHGRHCKLLWGVFSFGWFWRGAAHIEGDVSRVSHSCWFFLHKSLGSPHSYWTYQPSVFWLWSSNSELLLVQLLQFHHFRPCVGQIEKHVDCWA